MSKPKGPTWAQIEEDFHDTESPPKIEAREYTVLASYSRPGRSSIRVRCPFCRQDLTAYTWSLAGGGKRCACGALLGRGGSAYFWKPKPVESTMFTNEGTTVIEIGPSNTFYGIDPGKYDDEDRNEDD